MSEPSTEELRALAREVFGRELSDAEAEACRARLPTMARNVRTIRARQRDLGALEPALVPHVPDGRRPWLIGPGSPSPGSPSWHSNWRPRRSRR